KAPFGIPASQTQKAMNKSTKFPEGWDEARVKRVLEHYEAQTEDEAVAEDEAVSEPKGQTLMEVPSELVPAVRELIAKRRRAS
ncbi:MAG TPA: hypothetical protein VJA26_15740, partial [Gammaproteobacteria bacterium]|nr:hypothetical protein [Gammaproteobacteria bacterium]